MLDKPYAYLEKREALQTARALADREDTEEVSHALSLRFVIQNIFPI